MLAVVGGLYAVAGAIMFSAATAIASFHGEQSMLLGWTGIIVGIAGIALTIKEIKEIGEKRQR